MLQHALQQGITDWSQATLLYDALVSLHQTRLDSTQVTSALDEQITVVLQAMYHDLSGRYRQEAKYFFHAKQFNDQLRALVKLYKQRGGP